MRAPHLHACCSGQDTPPDTRPLHRAHLIRACRTGTEPLETLALAGMPAERDALLASWLRRGWTVTEIAQHTRSTTYTIGRLVSRLHEHARVTPREVA